MALDFYTLLVFFHVLLFAYWLGPDWGVFVSARRVANESLSREERLRFLMASVAIDILPRSSIVLIIAVGFTLAHMGDYAELTDGWIVFVWLMAAVWLLLVWLTGYILKGGNLRTRLDRIHIWLRHALTVFFAVLGGYSLIAGGPLLDMWLSAKVLLIAVLLAGGSVLRLIVTGWVEELRTDEASSLTVAGGIARTYPIARKLVYLFWTTTILIAFLGVTKPF